MKFKLRCVSVSKVLVLTPIECGLSGNLVYHNLPERALRRFKVGDIVEVEIPLPAYYPVSEPVGWQPKNTAAFGEWVFWRRDKFNAPVLGKRVPSDQGYCRIETATAYFHEATEWHAQPLPE